MNTVPAEQWRTGFQRAEINKFADRFVVNPISTGKEGLGVPCSPCKVLPLEATAVDLAGAVLEALAASSDVWPPPPGLQENSPAVLRSYGVKSYRDFDPIASVHIDRKIETGVVRLLPMKRVGTGHSPASDRPTRMAANASVETLARKLMNALAKSEAAYRPRRRRRECDQTAL